MKILIIGSGGREHALAWRLAQDPSVRQIFVAPGNPGIARLPKCQTAQAPNDTIHGYLALALALRAELTIPGPEKYLVAGIKNVFARDGLHLVGPWEDVARAEGSKIFFKQFLTKYSIPTAMHWVAETYEDACKIIQKEWKNGDLVLKADGLCGGKGVLLPESAEKAMLYAGHMMIDNCFGQAGEKIVIERRLYGTEASFICLTDGYGLIPQPITRDHKPLRNNNQGPNTGGMGSFCADPNVSPRQLEEMRNIALRVVDGFLKSGTPYTGILYLGFMLTAQGTAVLEANIRLGDPETQAQVHCIEGNLAEALYATTNGTLHTTSLYHDPKKSAACVVLASANYPEGSACELQPISGLDKAAKLGLTVFHAGTYRGEDEMIYANGGRVLGVTETGQSVNEAANSLYAKLEESGLGFPGMQYRTDIGRGLAAAQT